MLLTGVNVLLLGTLLVITEKALRKWGFEPYVRTYPGQYPKSATLPVWAQPDPDLGWVGNTANPDINPQGFRDRKDFSRVDAHSAKDRLMMLGDSFVSGVGSASENLPSQLEPHLQDRYDVFNLGVPGWGVDQMYLAYQRYRDLIRPHIVMLAFIDADIGRVLEAYRVWEQASKPTFAVENGELVRRGPISERERFLSSVMSQSIVFSLAMQQIYLRTEARAIGEHIFRRLAAETQQRHEEFIVVRIPMVRSLSRIDVLQRPMDYAALFAATHATYLDPSRELRSVPDWATRLYLPDGHMSVAGDQFLATYIYTRVFESRPR